MFWGFPFNSTVPALLKWMWAFSLPLHEFLPFPLSTCTREKGSLIRAHKPFSNDKLLLPWPVRSKAWLPFFLKMEGKRKTLRGKPRPSISDGFGWKERKISMSKATTHQKFLANLLLIQTKEVLSWLSEKTLSAPIIDWGDPALLQTWGEELWPPSRDQRSDLIFSLWNVRSTCPRP